MTKSDTKFFAKARDVAEISDYPKFKVGCVAVYQGKVIGMGCNTQKTHPVQDYYNKFRIPSNNAQNHMSPKLHAEINCLNQIKHMNITFNKVKLFVFRKCVERDHGIARPCPSCMAAIKDLDIKNIYYTSDDGYVFEKLEENKK